MLHFISSSQDGAWYTVSASISPIPIITVLPLYLALLGFSRHGNWFPNCYAKGKQRSCLPKNFLSRVGINVLSLLTLWFGNLTSFIFYVSNHLKARGFGFEAGQWQKSISFLWYLEWKYLIPRLCYQPLRQVDNTFFLERAKSYSHSLSFLLQHSSFILASTIADFG